MANFVVSVSRRYNIQTGPSSFPTWTELGSNITNVITCGSRKSLQISVSGYFSSLQVSCYTIPSTVGNLASNWSWIKGKHTIEFGPEIVHSKMLKEQDFMGDGRFDFAGSLSKNNLLDFMLGRASDLIQQANFYYVPTFTLPQAFVSDTWKVSRKLTLTLGVRWNPYVPLLDSAYGQAALFSPAAYAAGTRSKLYPNLPPGLLVKGDPGVPSRVVDSHYALFDPRVFRL